MEILWLILLVFVVWPLMAAANKAHKEETGVDMPTRSQMRYIRRKARKNGVSEVAAYGQWLNRKQKQLVPRHLKSK